MGPPGEAGREDSDVEARRSSEANRPRARDEAREGSQEDEDMGEMSTTAMDRGLAAANAKLAEENEILEEANQALRCAVRMMHRRAQKSEGAIRRLDRLRGSHDRVVRIHVERAGYWYDKWEAEDVKKRALLRVFETIPGWVVSFFEWLHG